MKTPAPTADRLPFSPGPSRPAAGAWTGSRFKDLLDRAGPRPGRGGGHDRARPPVDHQGTRPADRSERPGATGDDRRPDDVDGSPRRPSAASLRRRPSLDGRDHGSSPVDAGLADTGPVDAVPVDTRPVDPGPVDTGPVDTGLADTGPVDTGPAGDDPSAAAAGTLLAAAGPETTPATPADAPATSAAGGPAPHLSSAPDVAPTPDGAPTPGAASASGPQVSPTPVPTGGSVPPVSADAAPTPTPTLSGGDAAQPGAGQPGAGQPSAGQPGTGDGGRPAAPDAPVPPASAGTAAGVAVTPPDAGPAADAAAAAGRRAGPTGPADPSAADTDPSTGAADGIAVTPPVAGTAPQATSGSGGAPALTPSPLAARLAATIESLADRPPPRSVTLELTELEGLRVRVSMHGDGVRVAVLDGNVDPQVRQRLDRELQSALSQRNGAFPGDRGADGREQERRQPAPLRPEPWLATRPTRPTRPSIGLRL